MALNWSLVGIKLHLNMLWPRWRHLRWSESQCVPGQVDDEKLVQMVGRRKRSLEHGIFILHVSVGFWIIYNTPLGIKWFLAVIVWCRPFQGIYLLFSCFNEWSSTTVQPWPSSSQMEIWTFVCKQVTPSNRKTMSLVVSSICNFTVVIF